MRTVVEAAFGRIPTLLEPCRGGLVAAAVFSGAMNLIMVVYPVFTMQIYDRVLPSRSVETLAVLTLLMLVLLASGTALDALRARLLLRLGNRLEACWRARIVEAGLSPGTAAAVSPGTAAAAAERPLRDLDAVRQLVTGPVAAALLDLPWSPLFVGVVFLLHPLLGLATVAGLVLKLGLALVEDRLSRPLLDAAHGHVVGADAAFTDARLDAGGLVALGTRAGLLRRVHDGRDRGIAEHSRGQSRLAVTAALGRGARQLLQILLLALGCWLVLRDAMPAGAIVTVSMLYGRALMPVEQAVAGWRQLIAARDAHRRLAELLARHRPIPERTRLPAPVGRVEVRRLTGWPRGAEAPVVANVEFALKPGETLAIVGATGAGKSGLARLLVGAMPAYAGEVRLDGARSADWHPDDFGRRLGYLPQTFTPPDGTVAEAITRFGGRDDERLVAAARLAGAHEMILRLPLAYETPTAGAGDLLSPGLLRRIGLARSFYGEPRFLVLDEPMAHLDERGRRAVRAAVERLKSGGTTAIVASCHGDLLDLADTILTLRNGRTDTLKTRDEMRSIITRLPIGRRTTEAR